MFFRRIYNNVVNLQFTFQPKILPSGGRRRITPLWRAGGRLPHARASDNWSSERRFAIPERRGDFPEKSPDEGFLGPKKAAPVEAETTESGKTSPPERSCSPLFFSKKEEENLAGRPNRPKIRPSEGNRRPQSGETTRRIRPRHSTKTKAEALIYKV